MNAGLTSPRKILLAASAYAAVLIATIAWVLANDAAYRELQALYDAKLQVLESLKRAAPKDLSERASAAVGDDAATVAGPSETVAASALQRYLLNRLEGAGGFVQSVQAEPVRETMPAGLQRLSAQLVFGASIVALQRFLFDLETGLPFVFIDSLVVQPAATAQPGARVGDRLRVSLVVTSYWNAGKPARASQ